MSLEFWLDTQPVGTAVGFPATMQLSDGNFLVVWAANGTRGAQFAIYDLFGTVVRTGFINQEANEPTYVFTLVPDDDGGFTLLYALNGTSTTGLYIRHYDGDGQALGNPILVDNEIGLNNLSAQMVELPDGSYAVTNIVFTADLYDVEFRIVAADGTVGPVLDVVTTNAGQQYDPRVATNGQNIFLTWWDANTQDVRGQMLALDGTPIGLEFIVNSSVSGEAGRPQVEVFPNGNYIVTWEAINAPGADSDSGSARARIFSPTGQPLADEFVLNDTTAGNQGAGGISVLPDGTFIAAFWGNGGGFRFFDGNGNPISETLQTSLPLWQSSLVTIGDGRIAVFATDSSMYFNIIDARNGQLDGDDRDNILLSTRTGGSTIQGFGGNDRFYGNDNNDTFFGGSGNDEFRSRMGIDTLHGGPGDDIYFFTPFSNSTNHRTTVVELAGEGFDTVYSYGFLALPANVEAGVLFEDAGTSSLDGNASDNVMTGNTADNILRGLGGADRFFGLAGNDQIDGGSNIDTAVVSGNRAQYSITQTSTGVFQVTGPDGTDTLTAVEYLQFADQLLRLLPGTGVAVNFNTADRTVYQTAMNSIRDFDGNALGGNGGWLRIGAADVNGDGDVDQILVNRTIGRFATVGTAPDGLVYFADHGWAGETRVAGIYIDPLVQSGQVVAGSANDSQRRFQNDLQIENINRVLGAGDYDGDGLQEVYFALTDGTAYLHAYMHADGNIRYANYQSQQQVIDFLTANGFAPSTWAGWFPGSAEPQPDLDKAFTDIPIRDMREDLMPIPGEGRELAWAEFLF